MKKLFVLLSLALLQVSCAGEASQIESNGQNRYIGNPYSPGTGHYAGYEWAERTGRACSGNSNSFIEGCEEYYSQLGD